MSRSKKNLLRNVISQEEDVSLVEVKDVSSVPPVEVVPQDGAKIPEEKVAPVVEVAPLDEAVPAEATPIVVATEETDTAPVVAVAPTAPEAPVGEVAPLEEKVPTEAAPVAVALEEDDSDDAFLEDDSDEESVASVEMVQLVCENKELNSAIREVGFALEGINELRDTISLLNDKGGISKESFPFFKVALEQYSESFFEDETAITSSLESYSEDEKQKVFSLEALDKQITTLQTARASLENLAKEKAQDVNRLFTTVPNSIRVQLESLDEDTLTGAEVQTPAPVDPVAVVTAQVEDEIKEHEELQEDLVDSISGVEVVKQEIVRQNDELGGLTTESLLGASLALDSFTRPLGLKSIDIIPNQDFALEPSSSDKRYKVSLEDLNTSLEGIVDKLKDLGKRYLSTWVRAQEALVIRAPIMLARLNRLAKIAKGSSSTGVKGNITTNVKYLHKDGSIDPNTPKFLSEYFKISEILIGKFHVKAQEDFKKNVESISKLNKTFAGWKNNTVEDYIKALGDFGNTVADPRSLLSKNQLEFPVPGGRRLFVNKELIYKGSNAGVKKLDQFAHLNYPTRLLWRGGDRLAQSKQEMPILSAKEIQNLATEASVAISKIKLFQTYIEALSANFTITAPLSIFTLVKLLRRASMYGNWGNETNVMSAAYNTSNYMRFHVGYDAASTFMTVASGLISYSKKSLKAIKKASKE